MRITPQPALRRGLGGVLLALGVLILFGLAGRLDQDSELLMSGAISRAQELPAWVGMPWAVVGACAAFCGVNLLRRGDR